MNTKMDKNTNDYFDFLANTLSISNVITWNSDTAEKESVKVQETQPAAANNTSDFFSFLAGTLSIAAVVA